VYIVPSILKKSNLKILPKSLQQNHLLYLPISLFHPFFLIFFPFSVLLFFFSFSFFLLFPYYSSLLTSPLEKLPKWTWNLELYATLKGIQCMIWFYLVAGAFIQIYELSFISPKTTKKDILEKVFNPIPTCKSQDSFRLVRMIPSTFSYWSIFIFNLKRVEMTWPLKPNTYIMFI